MVARIDKAWVGGGRLLQWADAGAGEVDVERIEGAIRELLLAVGEDPDREGLAETPRRVVRFYQEQFRGLAEDPAVHLGRTVEQAHDEVVIVRDIEFASTCEHHLLPILGRAHLAYLPADGRVVGVSKLARTVDVLARRPQVQERLTAQIADALVERLDARGVAVVVEAQHVCMAVRGVGESGSTVHTSTLRGCFKSDPAVGAEVLSLMCPGRR